MWAITPTLYSQINSLQIWCAYRVLARVPLKALDEEKRRALFNKARKVVRNGACWVKWSVILYATGQNTFREGYRDER